jgi:hypothetical protein
MWHFGHVSSWCDNNIEQIAKKIRLHEKFKALKFVMDKLNYNFNFNGTSFGDASASPKRSSLSGTDEELIMVDRWLEIINEVINDLI